MAIFPLAGGGSKPQFTHLDLRPSNGADLKIVIRNVSLAAAGNYLFKATYTTSKPEVLTSAGNGAEAATLKAVPTIRRPYPNSKQVASIQKKITPVLVFYLECHTCQSGTTNAIAR